MDIAIGSEVHCTDGLCGRSTYVIIDPVADRITHVVVKAYNEKKEERLVPIDLVTETTPHLIRLRCSKQTLATLEPFVETEYVRTTVPYETYTSAEYLMRPYVLPVEVTVPVHHRRIPLGELAVRRGAPVLATDGHIGRVDEFLVDPTSGHITHLVLREGHLWGQKDVTIPVSEIDRIEENTVYLRSDKHSIGQLPSIPLRRPMR